MDQETLKYIKYMNNKFKKNRFSDILIHYTVHVK